ncbi:TRAP transporter large permease [Rhodococcus sp. 14-1411-2a]|uniref:TRAP transporter large permease n=1 Tax=Rhodococcus sp. 14-1411-2a TaxID=2023151 RepID=UPI00211AB4F2|nr:MULTISPECIES: TRAP transporter large permease [unclassified Rhodococcus (in: high G+C Gram-positive bacteria)]MDI6628891.1 TRAP transporter large permease [Rhodococcus sp. (in: high G+C Gram-positive bacteria)]
MTAVSTAERRDNPQLPGRVRTGRLPNGRIGLAILTTAAIASSIAMFLDVSKETTGVLSLVLLLSLIFLRMHIGFALLVSAMMGLWALRDFGVVTSTVSRLPFQTVAQWTLSVIPMFVFMGLLLWRSGVTEKLYDVARTWLGWMPGGLAVGTNLAGAGLASVSGSTVGTTYALARIGIPEMLRAGYDKRIAIGSVLAAGLPGQLIPPSITLVVFAGLAEVPVGEQLLAGVGPGIAVAALFSIALILAAVVLGRKAPNTAASEPGTPDTMRDRWRALVSIWPVPVLVLVVVVGMFSGIFTATEAGAAAAMVALFVVLFSRRRDRPWGAVNEAAVGTIASTGSIFLMLLGATALSRMLPLTGLTTGFTDWTVGLGLSAWQFIALMTVVYLILGMFLDGLAIMLLTVPLLMPTLAYLDISLLWFGVFVVFAAEIAVITPPVGILSYIIHGVAQDPEVNLGNKISLRDVFASVAWVIPVALLFIVLLVMFPEIATYIPSQMGG